MSASGLALVRVSVSFPRGRHHVDRVLWEVSLTAAPGEIVAILAQRAQGKTTLLRVAAGMIRPDRGQVFLDGQDIWTLGRARERVLSTAIALVRNGPPEVNLPILDGIAAPLMNVHGPRKARAEARSILQRVGASGCADAFWLELADWERALVGVARGIARRPRVLLVDDLTATLGLGEVDDFGQLVRSLAEEREMAVLMAVSDAPATTWAHHLATLAGGELHEA